MDQPKIKNISSATFFALIVILTIAYIAYWINQNIEKTTIQQYVGFQGKAKTNPYLATEFFLKRMGIAVTTIDTLLELNTMPPVEYTLIIPTGRETMTEPLAGQILKWVESGGQLIAQANPKFFSGPRKNKDPLLQPFGIQTKIIQLQDIQECRLEDVSATDIYLETKNKSIQIDFLTNHVLESEYDYTAQISGYYGTHGLQLTHGKGLITILSDINFIKNATIDKYDHAYFLYELIDHQKGVWLILNDDMPPLWNWLWQHAKHLVLISFILLIAWLYASAKRLGPIVASPSSNRRRMLEHISACGDYLWKNQNSITLLKTIRQSVINQASNKHPDLAGLPIDNLSNKLAIICALPEDQVYSAMNDETSSTQDFTKKIKTLKHIRETL